METNITTKSVQELFRLLQNYIYQRNEDAADQEESFLSLCHLAQIHGLSPILYHMVQKDRCQLIAKYPKEYERLKNVYFTSVARAVQQEVSQEEIQEAFRSRDLRILFFKGAQIRDFYPVPEQRTMGDMDALIRKEDREKAHAVMLELGYVCEQAESEVWVYRRGNIMIEMHTRIAGNGIANHFDYSSFFADAIEHSEEEEGRLWFEREYHFCFLIYHIAKHLSSTGAGIRMFLDIVIFLQHYGEAFDWNLADQLLREAALEETAVAVFALCDRWFGTRLNRMESLPEDLLDELEDYVIHGGTFGFETHDTGDVYRRKAHTGKGYCKGIYHRLHIWRDYLFPSQDYMVRFLPALKEYRGLILIAWIRRWWIGLFQRRRHSLDTIRSMNKEDGDRSYREYQMLKRIGL